MSEPIRVLVVEDDADVALYTKTVLEKRGLCVVMTVGDPRDVLTAIEDFGPHVIVTDIELPGMSGLELIQQYRKARPGIPVLVMTAHARLDYAVSALRNEADEFLTKPVSSANLVKHVTRLAVLGRERTAALPVRQVVLGIGAHPDDVEVGAGGILAAHAAAGDTVTILTLSRGTRVTGIRGAWNEGSSAADVIGARLILEDVTDLGDTESMVAAIRKVMDEVQPTTVYVHSPNESHKDHRAVYEAALVATTAARTIACYQGSSATVDFRPNRFVPVDGYTDAKLAMLACYTTDGPRPRYLDPDFVLATARAWSRYGQGEYCEPLEIVRDSADVTRTAAPLREPVATL
jgi:LmbE family N-acetylglucosaminyl deacetylase/ActR/RegA family two-component response regulator